MPTGYEDAGGHRVVSFIPRNILRIITDYYDFLHPQIFLVKERPNQSVQSAQRPRYRSHLDDISLDIGGKCTYNQFFRWLPSPTPVQRQHCRTVD